MGNVSFLPTLSEENAGLRSRSLLALDGFYRRDTALYQGIMSITGNLQPFARSKTAVDVELTTAI